MWALSQEMFTHLVLDSQTLLPPQSPHSSVLMALGSWWVSTLIQAWIFPDLFLFLSLLWHQASRAGWGKWEMNFRFQFSSDFLFQKMYEKKCTCFTVCVWKDADIFSDPHFTFASSPEHFSSPFLMFILSSHWIKQRKNMVLIVRSRVTAER